jgi:hypothetical protein
MVASVAGGCAFDKLPPLQDRDARPADAAQFDATAIDAAAPDAELSTPDAAAPDAAAPDAAAPDAAAPDAAPPDAQVPVTLQLSVPVMFVVDVGVIAIGQVEVTNTSPTPATAPIIAITEFDLGSVSQVGTTCVGVLAGTTSCSSQFAFVATRSDATATTSLDVTAQYGCPSGVDCAASLVVAGNAPGATLAGESFFRSYVSAVRTGGGVPDRAA